MVPLNEIRHGEEEMGWDERGVCDDLFRTCWFWGAGFTG